MTTKALGITRQELHNVIVGRSAITPDTAVKLEMAIGSTAKAASFALSASAAFPTARFLLLALAVNRTKLSQWSWSIA